MKGLDVGVVVLWYFLEWSLPYFALFEGTNTLKRTQNEIKAGMR